MKRKRREERKRGERRKKSEEKKERKEEKSKRERCIMGVKTPPCNCQKNYKRHGERERERERREREQGKDGRRDRKEAGENVVIEDRLRCENRICILFKH